MKIVEVKPKPQQVATAAGCSQGLVWTGFTGLCLAGLVLLVGTGFTGLSWAGLILLVSTGFTGLCWSVLV